jgi:rare lipoprotein A
LRPQHVASAALGATALCFSITGAKAVSVFAQSDSEGTQEPTARNARVDVDQRRLNLRAGRRATVSGAVRPAAAGLTVALELQRGGRWRTLDRDRTDAAGRYRLRDRLHSPLSARARVRIEGGPTRSLGRLNVFRQAYASWYGPGLYGQRTGCGGTLDAGDVGVAHKTLPCGARVTLRHRGRLVRVPVIDRGPYAGGREYDLTAATARRLRFHGHGVIQATR